MIKLVCLAAILGGVIMRDQISASLGLLGLTTVWATE